MVEIERCYRQRSAGAAGGILPGRRQCTGAVPVEGDDGIAAHRVGLDEDRVRTAVSGISGCGLRRPDERAGRGEGQHSGGTPAEKPIHEDSFLKRW